MWFPGFLIHQPNDGFLIHCCKPHVPNIRLPSRRCSCRGSCWGRCCCLGDLHEVKAGGCLEPGHHVGPLDRVGFHLLRSAIQKLSTSNTANNNENIEWVISKMLLPCSTMLITFILCLPFTRNAAYCYSQHQIPQIGVLIQNITKPYQTTVNPY